MAKLKWQKVPAHFCWNRVKSLRIARELSQPQLAVGAGVGVSTIYRIELGHEDRITEETKKKIARFFGVDIDDIFPAEMRGNEPVRPKVPKKRLNTVSVQFMKKK